MARLSLILGALVGPVASLVTHGSAPGPATAPAPAPATPICAGCEGPPADQCTCGASLTYLKCVAVNCHNSSTAFSDACGGLTSHCASELTFNGCNYKVTTCEGQFHQAPHGVVGLTLDLENLQEEAYCGPHGKCTGEVHVRAKPHKAPAGAWLTCELPKLGHDSVLHHCDVDLATAELVEGFATCTIPMINDLGSKDSVTGFCYLTEGKRGEKLTGDAAFVVKNKER